MRIKAIKLDFEIPSHVVKADRLTVYSQAWIQRQLYRDGFGLRCHDLDIFPNNTLQLAELIYSL